jgi:hypothetical protein
MRAISVIHKDHLSYTGNIISTQRLTMEVYVIYNTTILVQGFHVLAFKEVCNLILLGHYKKEAFGGCRLLHVLA